MRFYIDTENLANWVELLDKFVRGISYKKQSICMDIHVCLFYTKNSAKKKFTLQELLMLHRLGVHLIDEFCSCGSKNALDFQLSTYLGEDVVNNDDMFVIMSKDKGYDVVVRFLREKGKNVIRFPDSSINTSSCIGESYEEVLQYIKSKNKSKLAQYCINHLDAQISDKGLLAACVEGFVSILTEYAPRWNVGNVENGIKGHVVSIANAYVGSKKGKSIINNQFWSFFKPIITVYVEDRKNRPIAKLSTTRLPIAEEKLCTYFTANSLSIDEATYAKFVTAITNVLNRGADKVYFRMAVYNELRHLLGNRLGVQVYSRAKTCMTNEFINEMLGE